MKLVELGTILHMDKGKKPQKQQEKYKEGYLPYVDIQAFEEGIIKSYADPQKCLLCEDGDLLIVCDGSRSGLTGRAIKGVVGSTLSKISADGLCTEYLQYFIQSKYTLLNTRKKGTGTPHLNAELLKKSKLVIPTQTEQERIVSKIEELFSKLDASVAELKTAKEKLKVYRQAVLKEALTPEQGWCKCCFSDLMESVRNGYGKKPDDMGEYRILRISSVRPGKVELSDFRCNQTPFKEDDLISENDLLFTRYNGNLEYVGVCACVPQLQEKYAYPDKIIKCTPKLKNPYHSRFLQYSMNQGEARKYIRSKIKTTSGQKGIAGSDIKKVVLWLPELPVQEKIVKMIDEKMSTCDNIEQTIDISLRQAEAMRQSILKHAFKGGL